MNDILTTGHRPNVMQPIRLSPPTSIPPRAYAQAVTPPKHHRRIPIWLQVTLAVPAIIIASMFVQSAAFGQLAIVIYGIVALVSGISSRTTFTLAMLSVVATIILLVVRGDLPMAQNFATYTFLLLVAGVISLSRELKKEGGRIYSSRRYKQD